MNLRDPIWALIVAASSIFLAVSKTDAETVTLAWNRNPEPNIAGYRLYYGTGPAPFATMIDVKNTTVAIRDLREGVTYTFAVTAYNTAGAESAFSIPLRYTVGSPRIIPESVLANISSRALVETGENVMVAGFIVDGIVDKLVALRAIGPSLAEAGVNGAMADPVLELVDSTGAVIGSNDNWNVPGQRLTDYGLAPGDAREAGLVISVGPGAYSAIVSGLGSSTGVALVELYDLDGESGRVANVSTRSRVEGGDNLLIGGFILAGPAGTQVIVRAIGPSLIANGVADALLDPELAIYNGDGTLLAANDNWRSDQEAGIVATGLAPADNREAAIVSFLAPGAYSALIEGAAGSTGVALFEVYALNE